jgi:hypothetical protein
VNRNRLRGMYPALTTEERFRLSVQAGATGDEKECLHLVRSCPQVDGTAADPSFTGPLMASHRVAWAFAQTASGYLAWIDAVEAMEQLFTGESGRAVVRQEARVPVALALDETLANVAFGLRALVDAFEDLCRNRAELSSRTVLAFWVPHVATALREAEPLIDGLESDSVLRESFRSGLDRYWTLEPAEEVD